MPVTERDAYQLEASIQSQFDAEERIPEAVRAERMLQLAKKNQLDLADWIEITGFGIGSERRYTVSVKGIYINRLDEVVSLFPDYQQVEIIRQAQKFEMNFPCSPRELLDFVDKGAGSLFGIFHVDDTFRNAVIQAEKTDVDNGEDKQSGLVSGKNSRDAIEVWVGRKARQFAKEYGTKNQIAEEIENLAKKLNYQSEREPLTAASIIRMIPSGLTGGRTKKRRKLR